MLHYVKRLLGTRSISCRFGSYYLTSYLRMNADTSAKRLAAFDFDKTVVIENTDTAALNLLPKDVHLPYIRNGWTVYMRSVFELLHSNGIDEGMIDVAINEIPPIAGMIELIKDLSENLNYDVIIISDSNSHFISTWLKEHDLDKNIKSVFTNPAEFVHGLLKIEMFHIQDWCTLSEKNLCKGQVLVDFINGQRDRGVTYNQVIYVGDGQNDFCPIVRLNYGDLAFCRQGYKCAELVQNAKEKKLIQNQLYEIKAEVHLWSTGFDILTIIKSRL